MNWTYDYAIPHGLVYELNPTKLEKLPDDAVARDFAFWANYKSRLLSNPLFGSDFDARRSFSKLRTTGGNIYRHWKMFPEAERAYEEALDLWSCEGNALSALMQVQWQRGEFDAIQKRIEQARLNDPRNETWKKLASYAEQRKSLQNGIAASEAGVAKEPKNRDAWIRLVTLLTQAGESERAAARVASGLRELPEDPEYLRFAATYFQLSDHPGRSLEPAKKLTEIEPAIPANFYLLARAWYSETNWPAFYEAVGKAITLGGLATRTMIAQDPGFSSLHGEPEFQKLIHPTPPSAR
jgi:tetratricopeptide (TPR) repeat protein